MLTCPNCDYFMEVTINEDDEWQWECPECGYSEQRGDEEDYIESES